MIKLQVIGNLGRDCTQNEVNGKSVINFVVAHNTRFKEQEKTVWIDCSYWTDKTPLANYLKKGTAVYVEGIPDIRTYQTNEGKFGASITLRVQTLQLLGSKPADGSNTAENTSATNNTPIVTPSETDDLPF